MSDEPAHSNGPVFRPSKRRKLIPRKQVGDNSDESTPLQSPRPAQAEKVDVSQYLADAGARLPGEESEENTRPGQLLRQRKPIGAKRGGVGFSSSGTPKSASADQHNASDDQALMPVRNASDVASGRFMAPTGQVATVDDKHITSTTDTPQSSEDEPHVAASHSDDAQDDARQRRGSSGAETPQQQDTSGKPAQATLETRAQPQVGPRPKPPRLGRDGKPLRPRKDRHRRTSFDIARDAMVEQVLRESRLDLYEDTAGQLATSGASAGLDEDADERMAAEFRRDFMAAQEERNVRRPAAPPPSGKGDPVKGPKLGGSRSQRAAMRAMEEKAAKSKK